MRWPYTRTENYDWALRVAEKMAHSVDRAERDSDRYAKRVEELTDIIIGMKKEGFVATNTLAITTSPMTTDEADEEFVMRAS